MKQILNVEVKNYNIIITDEDLSKLMDEINAFTKAQKRLFVISQKVYNLYKKVVKFDENEMDAKQQTRPNAERRHER